MINRERVARASALDWIGAELEAIEALDLRRVVVNIDSPPGPEVVVEGRRFLLLGSNNYLDLARHPEVVAGAGQAAAEFGAGAGASRLLSGATPVHVQLERELAALVGAETALIFSSGYLANVSTIQALVGDRDAIFSDELNHASIIDGCRLSGAEVHVYAHANVEVLEAALISTRARRKLMVSDSVFSMEGDSAPLVELVDLARRHGAMLMIDESHAIGVLGSQGGGLTAALGLAGRIDVVMGTVSKALGSAGGFIAGSEALIDYLRHRARGFVFDTAPAPPAVGAALAALAVMRREPERRLHLLARTDRLRSALAADGIALLAGEAAIVPLVIGEPQAAVEVAAKVRARGVIAPAIRPPSVPAGTSRLRLTVSAGFTELQVDHAVNVMIEALT